MTSDSESSSGSPKAVTKGQAKAKGKAKAKAKAVKGGGKGPANDLSPLTEGKGVKGPDTDLALRLCQMYAFLTHRVVVMYRTCASVVFAFPLVCGRVLCACVFARHVHVLCCSCDVGPAPQRPQRVGQFTQWPFARSPAEGKGQKGQQSKGINGHEVKGVKGGKGAKGPPADTTAKGQLQGKGAKGQWQKGQWEKGFTGSKGFKGKGFKGKGFKGKGLKGKGKMQGDAAEARAGPP